MRIIPENKHTQSFF